MSKRVNTILHHFANRVSKFRLTRGWTQERLAHEMGISRNYICMIEGGRVPRESVVKLFEALENAPLPRRSEPSGVTPTNPVKAARQAAGLTIRALAAATHYKIGQLQAIEDDRARVTPQMAAALAQALPDLNRDALLATGGPHLSGPAFATAHGGREARGSGARYVPLITWEQAAELTEIEDVHRLEGHITFDAEDARAFAVTITGDSMEPPFARGDVAIVYPTRPPANGNLVLGRTRDGEVFLKRLTILRAGEFRFSSYNAVYPAFDRRREELAWLFPVASVHKATL
jgi:transcriptional regulator with XRE-family HTH domain